MARDGSARGTILWQDRKTQIETPPELGAMANKSLGIGLGQAHRLCQMPHDKRLAILADGLPIILESSHGFWEASRQLKGMPREAEILEGFATEEAAKILILMDAVRCPKKLIPSKMGAIVGWFYDHLARLIYADAMTWKPIHVMQLREYVEPHRKAHFVGGYAGEYILPNWTVYERESRLYADIEAQEVGVIGWKKPTGSRPTGIDYGLPSSMPRALELAEAMSALGLFTKGGLKATSEIWGQIEFADTQGHMDAKRLTQSLLERLIAEKLPSDDATDQHVNTLYHYWQLPMYDFDLSPIHVSLEELKSEQERLLWSEIGSQY